MTTQKEDKKPVANKDKYQYWDEIRARWIANQSHCDPASPSQRESFIEKGIGFCPEWVGEVGYLRYYIFHVDRSYIPGVSKLERIDVNKGFCPQNCKIVHIAKSNNNDLEPVESIKESVTPMNVTNNFIIIDNADKANTVIKAILSNLNVQSLALVDRTD